MRPIVLKVLQQEPVSQSEWQELFYGVHLVCLWDEKGATKIYDCLREDIVQFIDVSKHFFQKLESVVSLVFHYSKLKPAS